MSYYVKAQDALALREQGASWLAIERITGWQPYSARSLVSKMRCGRLRKPGPRSGAWTPKEDATLVKYWDTENSHQIAQRLGRSAWAVNSRARRLGHVKPGHRRDWWTPRGGKP